VLTGEEEAVNYYDSTILYLSQDSSFRTQTMLINSLVKHGYLAEADTLLSRLPGKHPEYEDFMEYIDIRVSLKDENRNIFQLTVNEEQTLATIAAKSHKTGFHARAIMNFTTDYNRTYYPFKFTDEPPAEMPQNTYEEEFVKPGKNGNPYFTLYPNPTGDKARVKYVYRTFKNRD